MNYWTGSTCGSFAAADIGLMGTKARKMRAVEGADIYMGGKVGKDVHLAILCDQRHCQKYTGVAGFTD